MKTEFDRLPALPLIANDPYFSIWLPGDLPTQANTVHWGGAPKWIRGALTVDGKEYRFLGKNGETAVTTTAVRVTPTRTCFETQAGGVKLDFTFWTPALPDDLDTLSTPITFADFACASLDGAVHEVSVDLLVPLSLCYDGAAKPEIHTDVFPLAGMNISCSGQRMQKVLCHSGDRITIDWGYLYTAGAQDVTESRDFIRHAWKIQAAEETKKTFVLLAYDDVAAVNYFGVPCRAWYSRNGRTIMEAIADFAARHDALLEACCELDASVLALADEAGGEDYQKIVAASWRHTFAAHKLIATPKGDMAFLSKENDSNGCIGTVDLSYPSAPLLLQFCPELVNAMCRPVLEFAQMNVWSRDYAPHDVGRYPHVHGQVYALRRYLPCGNVYPPYYLYPAEADVYNDHNQMPVEESGNMLVMLAAAIRFGADDALAKTYMPTLDKWVRYLDRYGEDPGEQLCTDDFAGHLAHNVNLSAKAVVGVACYARLLEHFGKEEEAKRWEARAHEMMESWKARACAGEHTPLTFDGHGWSMKYNLAWDKVLGLGLMNDDFYAKETRSYLPRMNTYGLPLDSRADYTKSDWIAWCATMAPEREVRQALLAPMAKYLRETKTRVPFSDWYDSVSGDYVEFIARSVLGGMFMPMLAEYAKKA